jgi:hypothetical protein
MTEDANSPTLDGESQGETVGSREEEMHSAGVREDGQGDPGTEQVGVDDLLSPEPNQEQLLYARILEVGMFFGLALLMVTFALYTTGLLAPGIPIEELPRYWEMGVHEYLEATNHDHLHQEHLMMGWAWLSALRMGDYLNFLPIALLSGVTIVCYLGIVPSLLRKKDWAYAIMALVEVVILAAAASGLLTVGH